MGCDSRRRSNTEKLTAVDTKDTKRGDETKIMKQSWREDRVTPFKQYVRRPYVHIRYADLQKATKRLVSWKTSLTLRAAAGNKVRRAIRGGRNRRTLECAVTQSEANSREPKTIKKRSWTLNIKTGRCQSLE